MAVDVVIPARNEEATIGDVIRALDAHPDIHRIIVVVDADTTDDTETRAYIAGAHNLCRNDGVRGKGQLVTHGLSHVETERVLFCDADIYGLTRNHISQLLTAYTPDEMVIGVPDFPPLEAIAGNLAVTNTIIWAWPWVSGQRCMLTTTARSVELHGYLMEAQLNAANHLAGQPVRLTRLEGLVSPFNMNDKRIAERDRDYRYGVQHGILPPWR